MTLLKIEVFWNVLPCHGASSFQHFEGTDTCTTILYVITKDSDLLWFVFPIHCSMVFDRTILYTLHKVTAGTNILGGKNYEISFLVTVIG
jgi:hypothetical protein